MVDCGYEDPKTLGCSPDDVKLKAMIDFIDNSENPELEINRLIELLKENEKPWLHPTPYMIALWDILLIRKATGVFPL
jgi:hypothetical protein